MNVEHRTVIASPPDRQGIVIEIWHGNEMWAEVANEEGRLTIELYPRESRQTWVFDYDLALSAIEDARKKLLGNDSAS